MSEAPIRVVVTFVISLKHTIINIVIKCVTNMWEFVCYFIWAWCMLCVGLTKVASAKKEILGNLEKILGNLRYVNLGKASNQTLQSILRHPLTNLMHWLGQSERERESEGVDFGWICTKSTRHARQVATKFPSFRGAIHNSLDTTCGLHSVCVHRIASNCAHIPGSEPRRGLCQNYWPLFAIVYDPSLTEWSMHRIPVYLIPWACLKYAQCPFWNRSSFVNYVWNGVDFCGKYKVFK